MILRRGSINTNQISFTGKKALSVDVNPSEGRTGTDFKFFIRGFKPNVPFAVVSPEGNTELVSDEDGRGRYSFNSEGYAPGSYRFIFSGYSLKGADSVNADIRLI